MCVCNRITTDAHTHTHTSEEEGSDGTPITSHATAKKRRLEENSVFDPTHTDTDTHTHLAYPTQSTLIPDPNPNPKHDEEMEELLALLSEDSFVAAVDEFGKFLLGTGFGVVSMCVRVCDAQYLEWRCVCIFVVLWGWGG